jgi:hypothetical protein
MRFPGETEEDYRMQAELVPKIFHLQPPWGIVKARADRGSPMFAEPESQSIRRLKPAVCYKHLFPKSFDLERVSYYFDHEMDNIVDEEHYGDLLDVVAKWQESWAHSNHPFLRYRKGLTSILIEDGRRRKTRKYSYTDGAAVLYEYCADARTPRDIANAVGSEPWVQGALDEFVARALMLFLDGRYLSLALPANPNFDLPAGLQVAAKPEPLPVPGFVPVMELHARR